MPTPRIHPDIQNIKKVDSLNIENLQSIIAEVKEKEAGTFNRHYELCANIKFAFRECCNYEYIDCAQYLLKTYPEYCIEENIVNIMHFLCINESIPLATFLFKENGNIFDVHINDDEIFKTAYSMYRTNVEKNNKQLCKFLLFDLKMTISDSLQKWIDTKYPEIQTAINNYHLYNSMHDSLPMPKKDNNIKIKI